MSSGAATCAASFAHIKAMQTGIFPDPRHYLPPHADPPLVEWQLADGDEAALAGDCFGDGSCSRLGEAAAARAGWAVVEVHDPGPISGLQILRSAYGTLPGPAQDSKGAELFAVVFWLRHLDPVSKR